MPKKTNLSAADMKAIGRDMSKALEFERREEELDGRAIAKLQVHHLELCSPKERKALVVWLRREVAIIANPKRISEHYTSRFF